MLMITAALIGLIIPVAAVVLFNHATGLTWKTIKWRSQSKFEARGTFKVEVDGC